MKILVSPNDPVLLLHAAAVPVSEITSSQTQQWIEEILDVAYGHRKDRAKPTVVGLAAPQIGLSQQIIAVDTEAGGHGELAKLQMYINPEIIWKSVETEEWCEGCWSTDKVCGVVSRTKAIKVKAYTREGEAVEEEHRGYVARIFQHEIDHLHGIEFVSHIADDAKLHWVEDNDWVEYKQKEGWRNWPKKCPREKWEKIKGLQT